MEAGGDAVDVVAVESVANGVEVVRRQLLRVVELVPVDEVAEALDRAAHLLCRRLADPLRLVAAGHEPRDHRSEGPDSETRLHASPFRSLSCATSPHLRAPWE